MNQELKALIIKFRKALFEFQKHKGSEKHETYMANLFGTIKGWEFRINELRDKKQPW